jgi:hypothetical protein
VARKLTLAILAVAAGAVVALVFASGSVEAQEPALKPAGQLVLYGDMTTFYGLGKPENCVLRSRYKRGDPVGFRMFALDRETGLRIEKDSEVVVHLSYAGSTLDIPMRYRGTVKQPQLDFWVAKWMVPADAPVGIIRYTVTARAKSGKTGEFKPFDNDQSQLTIVE